MLSYLPIDIVLSDIFSKVGIKSIVLLQNVSKEFHRNKRTIHSYYMSNDSLLYDYTKFYKINLIHTLTNSAISYDLFQKLYDYIKYNSSVLSLSDHGLDQIRNIKDHSSQEHINNTFKIFKLLKMSVRYNVQKNEIQQMSCSIIVTNLMQVYFKELYFSRNASYPSSMFMYNLDTYWETININLYNLVENLNFICHDITSEDFKTNLDKFNDIIVNNNGYDTKNTVYFLYNIFLEKNRLLNLNVYIYINYIIFRYMNQLFSQNIETKILQDKYFIKVYINKLYHYHQKINSLHPRQINPYFKDKILEELNDFMFNI